MRHFSLRIIQTIQEVQRKDDSMNLERLIDQSVTIITEYYKNNTAPFFEVIDDDILWIGPAERQWIRGKQNLLDAFSKESHNLIFSMSNITSTAIACGNRGCEIILTYFVDTHYPDGEIMTHDQRLHLTWVQYTENSKNTKKTVYKILVCHISNAFPYDNRDTIYPVHYEEVYIPAKMQAVSGRRIQLNGLSKSIHFVTVNTIMWAESKRYQTVIHTTEDDIIVTSRLSEIAEQYPDIFVRVHASYLVNPAYVRSISRFKVLISNQIEIPIPEKRYTEVKQELTSRMGTIQNK